VRPFLVGRRRNMPKRATRADTKPALLIWSVLCVPLLVYCGGKSDRDGSGGATSSGGSGNRAGAGAGGKGGVGGSSGGGKGGHTSSCSPGSCQPGCFGYPGCLPTGGNGGQAGFSGGIGGHTSDCASMGGCRPWCGDTCSGTAGEGGDMGLGGEDAGSGGAGQAGVGGIGFAGHTSICFQGSPCTPGCPPSPACAGQGGAGNGGAGNGGAGNGGASASAGVAGTSSASRLFPEPAPELRACYALPGYQDDPCLPPDDAIIPWLAIPADCDAHVSGGPFPASSAGSRQCCYAITCAPPARATPG
jgi:hypothetical protein